MAGDGGGYGWQPRPRDAARRKEVFRYGREYPGERGREPAEPGWVGGGRFPGTGYRTSGYRVGAPEGSRYADPYDSQGRSAATPAARVRQYSRDYPGFGAAGWRYDSYLALGPPAGAVDRHRGAYGPGYYTGGYSGRQLRRRSPGY